jgi:hypothetical protein
MLFIVVAKYHSGGVLRQLAWKFHEIYVVFKNRSNFIYGIGN